MITLVILESRQRTTNVKDASDFGNDVGVKFGDQKASEPQLELQRKILIDAEALARHGETTELAGEWRTAAEYVGSQSCRQCHAEQHDTYQQSAHSRAPQKLTPISSHRMSSSTMRPAVVATEWLGAQKAS